MINRSLHVLGRLTISRGEEGLILL